MSLIKPNNLADFAIIVSIWLNIVILLSSIDSMLTNFINVVYEVFAPCICLHSGQIWSSDTILTIDLNRSEFSDNLQRCWLMGGKTGYFLSEIHLYRIRLKTSAKIAALRRSFKIFWQVETQQNYDSYCRKLFRNPGIHYNQPEVLRQFCVHWSDGRLRYCLARWYNAEIHASRSMCQNLESDEQHTIESSFTRSPLWWYQ
jgi:hypothetical protein